MTRIRNRSWSWTGFVQQPKDDDAILLRGELDHPPDDAGMRRYIVEYENANVVSELRTLLQTLAHRKVRVTIEEME